jgi:uncharacterized membrane protein YkoI
MKRRLSIVITLLAAMAMVMAMSVSVLAAGVSSNSQALNIALKNARLKKAEVKRIDVDYEKARKVYEVEFTRIKNGTEFDYVISAGTGNIIKKSVEYRYTRNSSKSKIGAVAARKKVAKNSGISYKIISKGTCRYEYDDGEGVYEIKFRTGGKAYEYEVLAPTGKIIEFQWKATGK